MTGHEQGRPEESDVIKQARVQSAAAEMLVGELKAIRKSLDANTRALEELKKVPLGLDRNRQAIERVSSALQYIQQTLARLGRG